MGSAIARYRVNLVLFAVGLVLGVAAYARVGPGAASIDPGVQAALLLVISVALAATAGGAGAIIGANIAADATREAGRLAQIEATAARDDASRARDADRLDARRSRFAERKLVLAVDLLLAADLHRRQADEQLDAKWEHFRIEVEEDGESTDPIPGVDTTEPVRIAYLSLELVAPDVHAQAEALYLATVPLGTRAAAWPHPGRDSDASNKWARDWAEASSRWDAARHAFVDAVRADLQVTG